MKKELMSRLIVILAVCGLVFVAACTKPAVKSETTDLQSTETVLPDEEPTATASSMTEEMEEGAITSAEAQTTEAFQREAIHFDFDKSTLTQAAQNILRAKALWLRNNPDIAVVVEGHCDERGTSEYNLALGDRRAKSAMDFLVDMGIEPSRLSTISYGEEKPVDRRHNEAAWAKNRRAEFVIR